MTCAIRKTVLVASVVVCAGLARADIQYLTDTRTITTTATSPSGAGTPGSLTASGPVFNASVTTSEPAPSGGLSTATATQHSELLFDRIIGTGGGSASINLGGGSGGAYVAVAHSDLDVTFHLDGPTAFTLIASQVANGGPPPSPSQVLFNFEGGSLATPFVLHPNNAAINTSGILGAGDYHIEGHAMNLAGFGTGQTESFNFTLTVPAPAAGLPCLGMLLVVRRRR